MKIAFVLLLAAMGLFTAKPPASAQSAPTLDWIASNAAGGTSAGSAYSVSASVGQPSAGSMTGGSYSVVGGFWAIAAPVGPSNAPALRIRLSEAGELILSWPADSSGFELQQCSDLVRPSWSNVTLPPSLGRDEQQVRVPRPLRNTFYRLRSP
jgi:hypothetical protein